MILIGQYDSPFVRRVAVALRIYGFGYEHRAWSTFGDADAIAPYNPLRRVPTLVLDSGEALVESTAILDCLDEMAGADRALVARDGPQRRAVLRLCALTTGLCDKMVALIYERALHVTTSPVWIARCETQIRDVLDFLEAERKAVAGTYWMNQRMTHADVVTACAMRFIREAHPTLYVPERWPALDRTAAACEAQDAFASVTQVFIPPA